VFHAIEKQKHKHKQNPTHDGDANAKNEDEDAGCKEAWRTQDPSGNGQHRHDFIVTVASEGAMESTPGWGRHDFSGPLRTRSPLTNVKSDPRSCC
jgi:hypothetical protein